MTRPNDPAAVRAAALEEAAAWCEAQAETERPPPHAWHDASVDGSARESALDHAADAIRALAGQESEWVGVRRDSGVGRIAVERRRQVDVEGWSEDHDREHSPEDLALAGAAYAVTGSLVEHEAEEVLNACWRWEWSWWKPKSQMRNLVRAGALIAAAIDRLLLQEREEGAALEGATDD